MGKIDLGRSSKAEDATGGASKINEDALAQKLLTTLRTELGDTVREALAAPATELARSPELARLMDRSWSNTLRGRHGGGRTPADEEARDASAAEVAALRSEVSELCVLVTRGNELMREEMKDMWNQVLRLHAHTVTHRYI